MAKTHEEIEEERQQAELLARLEELKPPAKETRESYEEFLKELEEELEYTENKLPQLLEQLRNKLTMITATLSR